MKSLFLGDSITEGLNNGGKSFPDYFYLGKVKKDGVSGTTLGEYSIYPVDGLAMTSRICLLGKKVRWADTIFIEFGTNDIAACLAGYAVYEQVLVSFIKLLDAIKQTNPKADVYFLSLTQDLEDLSKFAGVYVKYMKEDYLRGYEWAFKPSDFVLAYKRLVSDVEKRVHVIPMFRKGQLMAALDEKDGLHPDAKGYCTIANNIRQYFQGSCCG